MKNEFHQLHVAYASREYPDSVEIGFDIPPHLKNTFTFHPGQYLTLKVSIGDKILRRAYSICSPTYKGRVSILVKKLAGGKVSTYLNDYAKHGDKIEVLPPGGQFKIEVDEKNDGTYYLIGAGSGITPLISMAESTLALENESICHLIYGNRSQKNTIYYDKLHRLKLVYGDRFSVTHVYSQPTANWQGKSGRINKDHIHAFLNEFASNKIRGYYICGPGPMIEASVEALQQLGIEKPLVHREYFTSSDLIQSSEVISDISKDIPTHNANIMLNGATKDFAIREDLNIVEAMVNQGVEPPYSCLSGSCSTCKAKLTKGKVTMDVNIGLEEGEESSGFILTCQSRPKNDISLTFDI